MNNLKISDLVKNFNGEEDIDEWIIKFNLIKDLNNIKNEEKILPMFLEGKALTVYTQLNEDAKKSGNVIKQKLREAFGEDPFNAYSRLINKKWRGESADVFMMEIQKIAKTIGIKDDLMIKHAFINGMPEYICKELRKLRDIKEIEIEKLIEQTRVCLLYTSDAAD